MNKFEAFSPYLEACLLVAIGVIATIPNIVYTLIWAPVAALLLLRYLQVRRSVAERHQRVVVQLKQLAILSLTEVRNLRVTYYVPVWRKKLQQTCDYILSGGGSGRRFEQSKGIIGLAYRQKERKVVNFDTDEDFRTRMKSEFGYTDEELRKITPDRRSYYCYPFLDGKLKVIGLAYFDSSEPNTFSLAAENITEQINASCDVINQSLL